MARRTWPVVAAITAALLLGGGLLRLLRLAAPEAIPTGAHSDTTPLSISTPTSPASVAAVRRERQDGDPDPFRDQDDLSLVYAAFEADPDPSARALAWRAWSVCVPTFAAAGGGMLSTDAAAKALDSSSDPARIAALATLEVRCAGFYRRPAAALTADAARNARRHHDGDLRSRAEQALEAIAAGNADEARELVRAVATSRDPYEWRALSGIVSRWNRSAGHPAENVALDAAIAVVGCDLGMDCGPQSLLALQACAFNAACEGDLVERTLSQYPDADRSAVTAARAQLARALIAGRFDPHQLIEER